MGSNTSMCRLSDCAKLDQSAKSAVAWCKCGTAHCKKDEWCKSADNSCIAVCASVDDSKSNVACMCGTTACAKDNTCLSSGNKCTAVPACTSVDGTTKSTVANCLCGTATCVKDQTCKSADNKCSAGILAGLVALIA